MIPKNKENDSFDADCSGSLHLEFNSKILIIFENKTALPVGVRQNSKNKTRGKIIKTYLSDWTNNKTFQIVRYTIKRNVLFTEIQPCDMKNIAVLSAG